VTKLKDAHSRIIWGISWSHDDAFYASASREKQKSIKVWSGVEKAAEEFEVGKVGELYSELPSGKAPSATAIQFFPTKLQGKYAIATGLETGQILVWSLDSQ
jgi:elongator complex protein 2